MPAVTGYSVTVPQEDGEIHFAENGDGRRTYSVSKHTVTVPISDISSFLQHVPGAAIADAPKADSAGGK